MLNLVKDVLENYIAFLCRLRKFKNRDGHLAAENERTAIF